jgi:chromosome segregation ATPase
LPEASASALPPILEEQNTPRNPEDGVIEENSEDEQITEAQLQSYLQEIERLQMQKANLEQDIATKQHSKNIRSSLIEAEAEYRRLRNEVTQLEGARQNTNTERGCKEPGNTEYLARINHQRVIQFSEPAPSIS